jgi:periplasmic protein TonB
MFRESLLETSAATVAQRGWATLMSFGLEMAAVSALLIVPLFITQAVPVLQPLAPPRMTSVTPEQIRNAMKLLVGASGDNSDNVFRAPGQIPNTIVIARDERPRGTPVEAICTDCVYDPTAKLGIGSTSTVLTQLLKTNGPDMHPTILKSVAAPPMRISHMDPGMLIFSVDPRYPELAKRARIQGTVSLAALIDKNGRIANLHTLGGPPLLVEAALDAVRQWRYRPTILNGQPVEVETQIQVKFSLAQ